jgi:hypothetical protein
VILQLFTGDELSMKWKISNKQYRLNLISAIILVAGLGSAVVIYLTAQDEVENVLGYDLVGGTMYPNVPSKVYDHNLELYGGKPLILANDMIRWFNGLWQGRSLAVTIAWISIITAGVIFFFNHYVSFEDETENNP